MTVRACAVLMSLAVLMLVVPTASLANDGGDRVQFFQSISVDPDDHVGDVVCIFCSIRMAGSCGDTVAIFGNIVIDGTVTGDAVSIGGGIKLEEDANVSGDAVAIGQGVYRHPNSTVKGQVVSQAGPVILLGLIVIPLLPVIIVVALVVWLVRRNRYVPPAQVAYRR
jgi:L-asparagine transporter-like permease